MYMYLCICIYMYILYMYIYTHIAFQKNFDQKTERQEGLTHTVFK